MDDRCLACHTEIAALRSAKRGLHARTGAKACANCHPDHGGVDFELVAFEEGAPAKFDHARSGWALQGAHAKAECRACHQPKFQTSAVKAKIRIADRTRTWLGLETDCASCHGDPHAGQLARDCRSCHDAAAWKPAARFDHARTSYPLTGRHSSLACAKCHAGAGDASAAANAAAKWKPVAHAECSSCHRDPHAGRFGAACAKCHGTADFRSVNEKTFDHARTRFPLLGAHGTVPCAQCHDPVRAGGAKPAFDRCDRCHRDAHAGQTARAGAAATDCAACHGVSGFRPSTFALAAHQLTPYPLEGAHARAACAGCHPREPAVEAARLGAARVNLHPARGACADCHGDPHGGRFSPGGDRAREGRCLACHDMERFAPSRADARAHATFAFALEGAHRALPCASCHRELAGRPENGGARATKRAHLEFRDARRRCAECHATPHGHQFDERRDRGACESCHAVTAFVPASGFDHDRDARFRLEGAHERTPCAACHTRAKPDDRSSVVWRPLSSRCESCHVPTR